MQYWSVVNDTPTISSIKGLVEQDMDVKLSKKVTTMYDGEGTFVVATPGKNFLVHLNPTIVTRISHIQAIDLVDDINLKEVLKTFIL